MTRRLEITDLRLRLLANGYVPLPSQGKVCPIKGWPRLTVDEDVIRRWGRQHGTTTTAIRLANGLMVIDSDTDDKAAMDALAERWEIEVPALKSSLVRFGKGAKEAWFCRTAEPFNVIHSFTFVPPGAEDDEKAGRVEIFGGANARYFGAFGPHTVDSKTGEVLVAYEWGGDSPADVPLAELPVVTKQQAYRIVEIAEAELRRFNWQQLTRSTSGQDTGGWVYDLTEDMVFDCDDGVTRTLAELRQAAGNGLRCSASWLEGPRAVNRSRCLVSSRTKDGALVVTETASMDRHMEASLKQPTYDIPAIRERLIRLARSGPKERN